MKDVQVRSSSRIGGSLLSASNPTDQERLLELLGDYLGGVDFCQLDEIPHQSLPPAKAGVRDDRAFGTLAHRLLANTIPFLNMDELGDRERTQSLLISLCRLWIPGPPREADVDICRRVTNTLQGVILELKAAGFELHCEYPIEHEFESGDVLSGSIDLLARKKGEVRIYDFKSSMAACKSESTKNQLIIYGAYLHKIEGKKPSISPILIGR